MSKRRRVNSCYECAAVKICPDKGRDTAEARRKSENCRRVFKGRVTDMVEVHGYDSRISLKRAINLVLQGMATWSDGGLVLQNARLVKLRKRTKVMPTNLFSIKALSVRSERKRDYDTGSERSEQEE